MMSRYSTDPFLILRVDSPNAPGGGGAALAAGKYLEMILGEVFTVGQAPGSAALPSFSVLVSPPGAAATFSGGTITPDVPGRWVFRATFANGRTNDVHALVWPAGTLAHPAIATVAKGYYTGVARPANKQREMLMSLSQDENIRDNLVGPLLESTPTASPAATLAAVNVGPFALDSW